MTKLLKSVGYKVDTQVVLPISAFRTTTSTGVAEHACSRARRSSGLRNLVVPAKPTDKPLRRRSRTSTPSPASGPSGRRVETGKLKVGDKIVLCPAARAAK